MWHIVLFLSFSFSISHAYNVDKVIELAQTVYKENFAKTIVTDCFNHDAFFELTDCNRMMSDKSQCTMEQMIGGSKAACKATDWAKELNAAGVDGGRSFKDLETFLHTAIDKAQLLQYNKGNNQGILDAGQGPLDRAEYTASIGLKDLKENYGLGIRSWLTAAGQTAIAKEMESKQSTEWVGTQITYLERVDGVKYKNKDEVLRVTDKDGKNGVLLDFWCSAIAGALAFKKIDDLTEAEKQEFEHKRRPAMDTVSGKERERTYRVEGKKSGDPKTVVTSPVVPRQSEANPPSYLLCNAKPWNGKDIGLTVAIAVDNDPSTFNEAQLRTLCNEGLDASYNPYGIDPKTVDIDIWIAEWTGKENSKKIEVGKDVFLFYRGSGGSNPFVKAQVTAGPTVNVLIEAGGDTSAIWETSSFALCCSKSGALQKAGCIAVQTDSKPGSTESKTIATLQAVCKRKLSGNNDLSYVLWDENSAATWQSVLSTAIWLRDEPGESNNPGMKKRVRLLHSNNANVLEKMMLVNGGVAVNKAKVD